HLAERLAREAGPFGQLVGLVDIGLVVLAVMEIERLGRHEGAKRFLGERKVGEGEGHGRFSCEGSTGKPTNGRLVQPQVRDCEPPGAAGDPISSDRPLQIDRVRFSSRRMIHPTANRYGRGVTWK